MNNLIKNRVPGGSLKAIALALSGLAGLSYVGQNSIYNVEGGHRAVIFNRLAGVREKVYAEGTHLRLPWFDQPYIFDVRTRPRNVSSLTGSRDLQMVNITLRVLSKPEPAALPQILSRIGEDYDDRVLPSIVNEVLKSVVAQFNASQLITQREQVSNLIARNLRERARDFHLIVDDVSLTHLSFGAEYTAAVEAKQVAAQEAERARFIVERAIQEKKGAIIRAQGEAKSAQLIGAAVANNPGFIELRRIEAAREIAETIARSNNRVYLDSDSLLLNVKDRVVDEERFEGDSEKARAAMERALEAASEELGKVEAQKASGTLPLY